MSEWQLISTAPRDGPPILGRAGAVRFIMAWETDNVGGWALRNTTAPNE